ncbi:MAG: NVEALA domain-containing protein [Tannerella sp.]|jgi:hypothetical protein|nr:NVEALA domain-containing protein [Tannerella sp.]
MNKKKIFGFSAALVITAMAVFNMKVNLQNKDLTDIALDNVEALAYELDEVVITCGQYTGQCWRIEEFPLYAWIGDITCYFSGSMNDFCLN